VSTTEQPVVAIVPEREDLPALTLTIKEFGFVVEALTIATTEDGTLKDLQGFLQGEPVPKNITRGWAKVLEAFEKVLLVQEVFDSLETTIIFSNSYDLILNFEPGTRTDFVLKSEWALLFKTLIEVLKKSGGISAAQL
jgi:hypothetical protein